MRAFPDRVALGSFSTELGDVKMCLYAYELQLAHLCIEAEFKHTETRILLLNKPFQGSFES